LARSSPRFLAGVPDHSLNGVPEYGLGSLHGSNSAPIFRSRTLTRNGCFLIDGTKLRALFVLPNVADRTFWYGVNSELSYNARHWEEARYALEIRPIVGWRFGPVDLILNPIVDLPFYGGPGALTFAPADRIAYNFSNTWTLAIEHYADYGRFANFEPPGQQYHALFGVIDYTQDPFSVEFGIGHGFTTTSEPLILKLMLTRTF
jgi:hypothetical protein